MNSEEEESKESEKGFFNGIGDLFEGTDHKKEMNKNIEKMHEELEI